MIPLISTKASLGRCHPRKSTESSADEAVPRREQRVCLTGNHHDFRMLHELILEARGQHPGILVIRRDNDPKRDLSLRGIVQALGNLIASGLPMTNEFQVLNHWR